MSEQPVELLRFWVLRQAGDKAAWLEERLNALATGASEKELHIVLGLAPRVLGKAALALTPEDKRRAGVACPGWYPGLWSLDGAARILALSSFRGERPFAEVFKDLRRTADANELVALYQGLPLYPEPETLAFEVDEGLRSNMRGVFEAIVHFNPYPYRHFDEHRFNHMILKALFIDTRLAPVVGLDERLNLELSRILADYARERRAAGREVPLDLWHCLAPYAERVQALDLFEQALTDDAEQSAAAARALLERASLRGQALLTEAAVTATPTLQPANASA